MNVTVRARTGDVQTIAVELEAAEVTDYLRGFYLMTAQQAGLHPEPGLTSKQLVERECNLDEVGRAASETVAVRATPAVLDRAGIDAVGAPDYGCHGYAQEGQPFAFDLTIVPKTQMELTSYDPVEVPHQTHEVTEEEVDAFLAQVAAVRNLSELGTPEQLRQRAREDLQAEADERTRAYQRFIAADALASRLTNPVPDAVFAAHYAEITQDFRASLAEQEMTEEDYLRERGLQADELKHRLMSQAREQLRQGLALDALARHENLKLTTAELKEFLASMSEGRPDELLHTLKEQGGLRKVEETALRAKTNDWLVRTARVA